MADLLCRCGCNGPAVWLVDGGGDEYEPPFKAEPCCNAAKAYLFDCAAELGFYVLAILIVPKPLNTIVLKG